MKNRYGVEYSFVKCDDKLYKFNMSEEGMKYMRVGGKHLQEQIDNNDLGMFDPSGGPYVHTGYKIYWDEQQGGKPGDKPLIVESIRSTDEGIYVEVSVGTL
jgi:hypothetical protein